MEELLVTVDENDNPLGLLDKLSVHQKGILHRAFSLFIFNSKAQLLLQRRSSQKYHSAGLWSNSCCSHPRVGETVDTAIKRRVKEEMGIECEPQFKFSFIYKTHFENGLTEHELDHVYFGRSDELPLPDSNEVQGWKYIDLEELRTKILMVPDKFSHWLKVCLPQVIEHFNQENI